MHIVWKLFKFHFLLVVVLSKSKVYWHNYEHMIMEGEDIIEVEYFMLDLVDMALG